MGVGGPREDPRAKKPPAESSSPSPPRLSSTSINNSPSSSSLPYSPKILLRAAPSHPPAPTCSNRLPSPSPPSVGRSVPATNPIHAAAATTATATVKKNAAVADDGGGGGGGAGARGAGGYLGDPTGSGG